MSVMWWAGNYNGNLFANATQLAEVEIILQVYNKHIITHRT